MQHHPDGVRTWNTWFSYFCELRKISSIIFPHIVNSSHFFSTLTCMNIWSKVDWKLVIVVSVHSDLLHLFIIVIFGHIMETESSDYVFIVFGF